MQDESASMPLPTRELTVAALWRWLLDTDVSDPVVASALLDWAPDVCALTSVLLERSHAFRFVVSTPDHDWPPPGEVPYQQRVADAARAWRAAMDTGGQPPDEVRRLWEVVRAHADTPISEVADGRPWELCEATFLLHAIADESCAGIAGGVAGGGPGARFRAKARELLTRHGSVSRLPSDHVTLLPKGRTTSVGITHRSLSRYLATAWGGINVVWHRVPLRRQGTRAFERHANVLLLPWPLRIRESDFVPVPGSVRRPEREPFGFFSYEPSEPLDLGLVDRLIDSAQEEVDGVDVVVLPEGRLAERDIPAFEELLQRRRVPMLVSGLRPEPPAPDAFPGNSVHSGVLVGDRWWHYRQNKHHRWFLDSGQIEAYNIAGALHPSVRWWEAMDIPKRTVHILDLGGGVTVAAVICEDLARLDGVAELLRSVGPTLVLTLLLDGPQLASRWTARYASVLADDPGSAVLTMTALGMATRSQPRGMPPSRVIAMWKDPARGLREIACEPAAQGVLLKIVLDSSSRYSADGRTPVDDVTNFHIAGVHQLVGGAAPASGPSERPGPIDLAEPELDGLELSVLSGWAEAVAETMAAGGSVEDVITCARANSPWRAGAGTAEPSEQLQAALDLLAEAATTCVAGAGSAPSRETVREAYEAAEVPDEPLAQLVWAVLGSGLDGLWRP